MRKNDRLASKARYRALHRLKSLYPKVFADFQDAERVKLGIPPVGKVPLGRHTTKAAET